MTRPIERELQEQLKELVQWEDFALHLPKITQTDINIIKRENPLNMADQKRALFDKWLRVHPPASWQEILLALEKVDENTLQQNVREYIDSHQKKKCGGATFDLLHLFSSSPDVERLLQFKQGDVDTKWAQKTIYSLVKKLKKQKGSLKELERALSQANAQTGCITIPRCLDNQSLPHVIFCRIWRWPDLLNYHELKSLDHCKFACPRSKTEVCINPYHYCREGTPVLPPVLVPRKPQMISSCYEPIPSYLDTPKCTSFPVHYHLLEPGPSGTDSSEGKQPEPTSGVCSSSPDAQAGDVSLPSPLTDTMSVEYQEPPHWCSIVYYELHNRVGEPFIATCNDIVVDGFTDPCANGERFCVGLLSNDLRNSTIERTRNHIGKGVSLVYCNGRMFAECHSENAIFVESRLVNASNMFKSTYVCKIPSGHSLKIFDNQEFARMLAQSVCQGFEAVLELTKMCIIQLSFVKGWGGEYYRQNVINTPCWIEIYLNGPLMWLDRVLSHIGPPQKDIGSNS